jgi:hypothetical protein
MTMDKTKNLTVFRFVCGIWSDTDEAYTRFDRFFDEHELSDANLAIALDHLRDCVDCLDKYLSALEAPAPQEAPDADA